MKKGIRSGLGVLIVIFLVIISFLFLKSNDERHYEGSIIVDSCIMQNANTYDFVNCVASKSGSIEKAKELIAKSQYSEKLSKYDENSVSQLSPPLILNTVDPNDIVSDQCYMQFLIKEKKNKFHIGDKVLYLGGPAKVEATILTAAVVAPTNTLAPYNGMLGKILEGPITKGDGDYYKVTFYETDSRYPSSGAYFNEKNLTKVNKTKNYNETKFQFNDNFIVTVPFELKKTPSFSGKMVANLSMYDTGRVIGSRPEFKEGAVWYYVEMRNMSKYSGLKLSGWLIEDAIEEIDNINFTLNGSFSLYGDYGDIITRNFGENFPYNLNILDITGKNLGGIPLHSSRILYYDNDIGGGMIEVSSGIHTIIAKYAPASKVEMDNFGIKTYLNIDPEKIKCSRTCGKYNERVDTDQPCCEGYHKEFDGINYFCQIRKDAGVIEIVK